MIAELCQNSRPFQYLIIWTTIQAKCTTTQLSGLVPTDSRLESTNRALIRLLLQLVFKQL